MPRKPSTVCRKCGKPRKEGSRMALCDKHIKEAVARHARTWREAHPEQMKAIMDKQNAKRRTGPRVKVVKVADSMPVSRRPNEPKKAISRAKSLIVKQNSMAPTLPIVIGPAAINVVKPVDVRAWGRPIVRQMLPEGWGR